MLKKEIIIKKKKRVSLESMALWLSIFLILIVPFDREYQAFRKFSRYLAHRFESTALFPFPFEFYRIIHYYLSDVLILLISISLVASKACRAKTLLFNLPTRWLYALVLTWFFSIMLSPCSHYYYLYLNLLNLALPFLACGAISQVFRKHTHVLYWVLAVIAMLGAFEALMAMGQFLTQEKFGIYSRHHLGFATLGATKSMQHFFEFLGVSLPQEVPFIFRANGSLSYPNSLAVFLVFSLMASHYMAYISREKWRKGVIILVIMIQILALGATFSRAGILGYLVANGVWSGRHLFCRQRSPLSTANLRKSLFILSFPLLLLSPFLLSRGSPSQIVQLDHYRAESTKLAIEMFQRNPILGMGHRCSTFCPGIFAISKERAYLSHVHNIYLIVLAETGLIGITFFCCFVCSLLWRVWKRLSLLSFPFLATFVGFLVMGLYDHHFLHYQTPRLLFSLVAGFLTAISAREKPFIQTPLSL